MENLIIRNETAGDQREVERLIREAFWDVHAPGCAEHYLAHILRGHPDFVPELDLVVELDGQVVGSILYTRAALEDEAGERKTILAFGPIAVHPAFQRRGYGKLLIERSLARGRELGYEAAVIFGNPDNYASSGFKSCKKYNICTGDGVFPAAMLAKELCPGALDGRKWTYCESPAYQFDPADAQEFDRQFPPKEKGWRPSQEMFYIMSHASLQ